jgi:molybdopterin-guanine dinucleotide biosynthesis protein MobB
VAATRIISIIGRKNSGKTTLIVALAAELARRGHRVMTIKRGHHPADLDREGTDSWRHFHEGRAERVLLSTPELRVLFDRTQDNYDPIALTRQYLEGADIALVEGYKQAHIPKIEVHRTVIAPRPLYADPEAERSRWIAIVTDDATLEAECPVLHFQDTMWLQLLANLAWGNAQVIPE